MRTIILLLILVSLSFSSLLGQYGTDGAISIKPIVYQESVVVASDDGNVYALNPSTASLQWKTQVGKTPNEVFIFDNAVVASTSSGKLSKIGSGGRLIWSLDLTEENVSYIYGASANDKNIYVSADNGLYAVDKDGNIESILMPFENGTATAPVAGPNYIILGKENELIRINDNGYVQWTSTLKEGKFWLSRPVIDEGAVYIGALDNALHAYAVSNGLEIWKSRAKNWITSTPLVDEGRIYFGSNDGKVYAVGSGSGQTIWEAQTQLAVQTEPESGYMGGEEVIFIGGSDKHIYAISKQSGEIVWKGSAAGAIGSPMYYVKLNSVIFGSEDQSIYVYSTERACSITQPLEADLVGRKELVISGNYVSEAGGAKVFVNINNAGWEETESTEVDWMFYVDPSKKLGPGLNEISCIVRDSGGEESGPTYTTVAINHDPSIALSKLIVTVSPNIVEGEEFTVFVNDGDDGSPIDRFSLAINGDTYEGNGNVSLTVAEPGSYSVTAKKMGFDDKRVNINVNAKGISPLFLGGGIVLIIVIIFVVWSRFLKQRFRKK